MSSGPTVCAYHTHVGGGVTRLSRHDKRVRCPSKRSPRPRCHSRAVETAASKHKVVRHVKVAPAEVSTCDLPTASRGTTPRITLAKQRSPRAQWQAGRASELASEQASSFCRYIYLFVCPSPSSVHRYKPCGWWVHANTHICEPV